MFARFTWGLLVYTLLAIGWGVIVRATFSGDGCGDIWLGCDTTHTPLRGDFGRFVELTHRLSTAILGPLALGLVVWAHRMFGSGTLVRRAAIVAFGFTALEGLVGAALVKFQLVTEDDRPIRAVVMAFHVVSTYSLIAALAVTALAASGAGNVQWRKQGVVAGMVAMAFVGVVMLGFSGAVSALAHQLYPTENVLAAAKLPSTHWLVRLQPLHPFIAGSVALYFILFVGLMNHLRPSEGVRRGGYIVLGLYGVQCVVGAFAIWFKAPLALQVFHLIMADVLVAGLTAMTVYAFQADVEHVEWRPAPAEAPLDEPLQGRALINAYVALTKPRVISLLLFTTLTAMVAAQGAMPPIWQFLAVTLGGYMSAGAANAINMVIDRDIDITMKRTASRPTVTQAIPSRDALMFAFALTVGSFAVLWASANLLSAVLAFSGLVFYVVVYTMLLKRRTWHNIVIGGAAGAFPPLVGWAAVTNSLPPLALYLFAIIFVWTPVHFWALALMLKDEYASAGVPMLPVVKGDRVTVQQIVGYTVVTVITSMVPFLYREVGYIYGIAALVLNVLLVKKCIELYRNIDQQHARSLFRYSMLYLALLFLAFAISRSVVLGGQASARVASISVRFTQEGMNRQGRQEFITLMPEIHRPSFLRGSHGADL
ncbi:MAG: heme o synthase [Fimbriimonadaceae bacterium]|nr:heme o synthase [Fimbriimonadaceae bacterium]